MSSRTAFPSTSMPTEDENESRVLRLQRHALIPSGAALGRYVIDKLVGVGGMGCVYLARDPNLDRNVALKVLHRGDDDGRRLSWIFREARALAKLSHPNVVAVYDADSSGDDVFLAMEFVDGETLAEWLARAEPSPVQVLDAFAQAGRGLSMAHAAGLAHRDFKPENVLVGRDGRVRVTDFGLATIDVSSEEEATAAISIARSGVRTTRTGARVGTLAYMAPEQHLGGRADARSDQFSYCVALYEALYGNRPFGESRAPGFVDAVLAGDVLPPSRLRIPRAAHAALLRGLKRDPAERFASMDELMHALGMATSRRVHSLRSSMAALGGVAVAAIAVTFGPWKEPPPLATTRSDTTVVNTLPPIEPATIDAVPSSSVVAIPLPSSPTRPSRVSGTSARPATALPSAPRTRPGTGDLLDRFD